LVWCNYWYDVTIGMV